MISERQTAHYEVWRDTLNIPKVLNFCLQHQNTDIVFDVARESSIFNGGEDALDRDEENNKFQEVAQHNAKYGNRVYLIIGNYKQASTQFVVDDTVMSRHNALEKFNPNKPLFETLVDRGIIDEVFLWPNFFLTWDGFKIFQNSYNRVPGAINVQKSTLFILKVRQAKAHRILLLDELAKRNLLENNIYTCLDPNNCLEEQMELVGAEHFDGERKNLNHLKPQFPIYDTQPQGWESAFMEVVSETNITSHFYTEKTVWPIVYMKPFLIHGAQYQNRDLQKFGFVLYDEIFDYSFDDIASPRERTIALAEELKRLQSLNLDLNKVTQQLLPKLEHNMCRYIDLLHNDEYLPSIISKLGPRMWKQTLPNKDGDGIDHISPNNGSWLAYIDSNGRNYKAVECVRGNPYLANLYRAWK